MVKQPTPPLPAERISGLCMELALMQKAGISTEESVSLLLEDAAMPQDRALLSALYSQLILGAPLSEALTATGRFPDYMLRMVEIGQASGRLEQVLSALAVYYQKQADTNTAVRKAVAYPMGMAVLIALIFLVLISQVLPVFDQVFHQLGMTLSPLAKGLMSLGTASKYLAFMLSGLLLLAAVAVVFFLKTKQGQALWIGLRLRLFPKSKLSLCLGRSRFAASMALMLSSGLHTDEALDRTCRLLAQTAIAPRMTTCNRLAEQGTPLAEAARQSDMLTGAQASFLSSGYRAGLPEQAMEELSLRCQAEADERLSTLLSRFEYTMVLVLCLTVGLVLLSVMLPLLGVLSGMGG